MTSGTAGSVESLIGRALSEDPSIPLLGVLPWEAIAERGVMARTAKGGIFRYNLRPESVRSSAVQSVKDGLYREVHLEPNHTHLLFTERFKEEETAADNGDEAAGQAADESRGSRVE
eukprot:3962017-Prymnesium_polylepis.1